ncbi:MAG: hypothetical protein PHN90_07455 [Methanothrix sp.]|nr:hypothetical protein [Methanothrix sp.]OPX78868.1 MAG: hypothetical protein A4E50_02089 [Methanosaeta sp. PtaB.Bin087]OPY56469.1 MAG: hypothetical protein A4E51_00432 [Methanosaeta sp. PtaU1.Bin055]NLX39770.1 hypothetical protein [Methanothrix sp.]HNR58718.1 hypothetical protein [Methanothrix sp.]
MRTRQRPRTGTSGRELWRLWRDQFDDDLAALAEAIWAANKLVKTEPPEARDRFYAIKDEFILRYATSGRRVRDEPPPPWYQGVHGSVRTLYCYRIPIGDRVYRLHSYLRPPEVEAALAEDGEKGGGSAVDEWSWLPISFDEFYKMLASYARDHWGFSERRAASGGRK